MGEDSNWCTCKDDGRVNQCLGCAIERRVKEYFGSQGLRFLKQHLKDDEKLDFDPGSSDKPNAAET